VFSLEVHLSKTESSCWPELVPSDNHGTRVFTAEQMAEISNQLEKFTEDKVFRISCFNFYHVTLWIGLCHTGPISLCVDLFAFICVYLCVFVLYCIVVVLL